MWVPTLLDRAGNAAVLESGRGYITAYTGIELLDIPVAADRSSGDVHIFGNPHLTTDPLRTGTTSVSTPKTSFMTSPEASTGRLSPRSTM